MELEPYVARLREELAAAAEMAGNEARELAERLATPLESAARLALLEALSAAADEISRDLAPGSVYVRLRGREPSFVVTPARPDSFAEPTAPAAGALPPVATDTDEGSDRPHKPSARREPQGPDRAGRRPGRAVGQQLAHSRGRGRARVR